MPEMSRRLTTILAADVAGFSKLAGADEEGTISRLRALGQEVIDPVTAAHGGRVFKTTGDGRLIEFASVVDAVRGAMEMQSKIAARNAGVPPGKRIEFRIGIHLGDVMVESDGDLMGDGVNIAARLEGIAEIGGICISEDAYRQVRDKIAAEFGDLGERSLKNIARPVRAYRVSGVVALRPPAERELTLPDKPSLAVLPFNVLQGDADDEALADGLSEDIVTALSRMRGLFVIARNSSFTYKGRAVDVRQAGRELGVRYILEGSVRRSGGRLRVTAQLIEASSGNHIWAEKYDRPAADVFDIQDDITRSVAASTQTHIQLHEGARSRTGEKPNLNVWLLIKQSWARLYELTPEALIEARALAEKAVQLAPDSGLAHEVLGNVLVHQMFMLTVSDRRATLLKARDEAEKAARLEGWTEYTYWCLGMVRFALREHDGAILTLQQGLEINPNCALIHASTGNYLALMGRADESLAATELSIRINPRDPSMFFRYQALADACFVKRDFEKMPEWAAKAVVLKPSYFAGHLRRIAALALLGREKAATSAIEEYVRDVPDAVRSRVRGSGFVRAEDDALFSGALAKAGMAA
jgi:adenylate cyclase